MRTEQQSGSARSQPRADEAPLNTLVRRLLTLSFDALFDEEL